MAVIERNGQSILLRTETFPSLESLGGIHATWVVVKPFSLWKGSFCDYGLDSVLLR